MPKVMNVPKGKQSLKPKLMKFEVLEGIHKHGDYTWLKGEVIATALDLEDLFQNKFKRVPDETKASKGRFKFRYHTKGTYVSKTAMQQPAEELADDEDQLTQKTADPVGVMEGQFQFLQAAMDVTEQFPFVTENAVGLVVLQNGSKFGVVEKAKPQQLLNPEPLKKGDVQGFVERFLDE